MRLPWGTAPELLSSFVGDRQCFLLGCLGTEERCTAIPRLLASLCTPRTELFTIIDPDDGFPDYSVLCEKRRRENEQLLNAEGVQFDAPQFDLLTDDDPILSRLATDNVSQSDVIVLDITSLPKRFFCYILSRLLRPGSPNNVIVTYTQSGPEQYTSQRLCEQPQPAAPLPGFHGASADNALLLISAGFEPLGIGPMLKSYKGEQNRVRVLAPFPPHGSTSRRVALMLAKIADEIGGPEALKTSHTVAAAWDTEAAYSILTHWGQSSENAVLAPFGPKPHTLAMALFAIKQKSSMWYSQPLTYHPDYSRGIGQSWGYVVKWDGIACFDRQETQV